MVAAMPGVCLVSRNWRCTVTSTRISLRFLFASALAAAVSVACSGNGPTSGTPSPLFGLTQSPARDSTGGSPPPPPVDPTYGTFHGTVIGLSVVGGGPDTIATAPRVAGVVVTAFPRIGTSTNPVSVGPAAATVVTGADGKFQLPTLAGGEYVVTFNPPAGSGYGGVWVTSTASSASNNFPWWVVLWRK